MTKIKWNTITGVQGLNKSVIIRVQGFYTDIKTETQKLPHLNHEGRARNDSDITSAALSYCAREFRVLLLSAKDDSTAIFIIEKPRDTGKVRRGTITCDPITQMLFQNIFFPSPLFHCFLKNTE